jgi:hypothetical protein
MKLKLAIILFAALVGPAVRFGADCSLRSNPLKLPRQFIMHLRAT